MQPYRGFWLEHGTAIGTTLNIALTGPGLWIHPTKEITPAENGGLNTAGWLRPGDLAASLRIRRLWMKSSNSTKRFLSPASFHRRDQVSLKRRSFRAKFSLSPV